MRARTQLTTSTPLRRRAVRFGGTLAAGLVIASSVPVIAGASAAAAPQLPPAVQPATKPAPLGPVLFIGDSVGASIKWALTPLLKAGNYSYHFDALSGRCTLRTRNRCSRGDAWDALDALDPAFKPTFAVIELGYNDTRAALTDGVDRLMQALVDLGVQKVYWINLSERRPSQSGSVYGPSNDILEKAANRWGSKLTLLDWNGASSGSERTGWFIQGRSSKPDLIHLTTTGQKQFAQWIRDELDRLRTDGHLPGSEIAVSDRPDLRLGDSGDDVAALQQMLVDMGYSLRVDGEFGPKTLRAVKSFQRANGLRPDGWVGKKTWKKLGT